VKGIAPYLLIAVIVGCGVWLFVYQKSKPAKGATVAHLQPLACSSCEKYYAMEVGDLPTKCHYCGKPTAWHAAKCANCGAIVPIPVKTSFQGPTEPVPCPKCGKSRYGEVPFDEIQVIKP